jgi:uncharacterized membrane protein
MTELSGSTVVSVFENRRHADLAVDELRKAGFGPSQIGVVTRNVDGTAVNDNESDEEESHATSGAVAGALAGAGVGGLVGLGVLAGVIPVVGPAIAAGTLATILANAAGGAAIGGLAAALIGWGVPEEHAQYYDEQLQSGKTVVTVHAGHRANQARMILNGHQGYSREPVATKVERF